MRILGIETSCDETGAAIIEGKTNEGRIKLLSNIVASSLSIHAKTGGIIPEVAAREQVKYITPVIEKALKGSTRGVDAQNLAGLVDTIAVTVGPGLVGSLLVGVETAKTLAFVWGKPIIPVNHLIGHIYANWIKNVIPSDSERSGDSSSLDKLGTQNDKKEIEFPALALIVSGGHTDLVLMKGHGNIIWLGGTRDDAAGEAFDKVGRLLGLTYPGGPAISAAAEKCQISPFDFAQGKNNKSQITLPRPLIDSEDFDFSFSGLKTAVLREVKIMKQLSNEAISILAAEVQQAIVDVLVAKTIKAAQKYQVKSILLGGGVAANNLLRKMLEVGCQKLGVKFFVPPKNLCTDNAAMIAAAAFFNLARKGASSAYKPVPWRKIKVDPSLHF